MLSRSSKALFYATARPLMTLSGAIYKVSRAPRTATGARAHLGPGQKNYIDGWINVDANIFSGKADVWADLRDPLPFWPGTLKAAYSHQMIEHLPDMAAHCRDVFDKLAPGGVYRVAAPSGDGAIEKFLQKDSAWFGDFPEKRRSIGGRFENFVMCKGEHLTIITASFMEELLEDAGFREIRQSQVVTHTFWPELFADVLPFEYESCPECPHILVFEATKT